jgi:indolepyruvate ferredoxin oxidoreductase alpha subunit
VGTEFVLRRLGVQSPISPKGLKKGELIVTSDIGCYTLGVYPPLSALDTCACMGASIGHALGLEKAGVPNKAVAVLGDSTFMHSGITGLIDVVYSQGNTTVIILDNDTTAMTGHQGHPGTGLSVTGSKAPAVKPEKLAEGIGVRDVSVVDAFDLKAIEAAIKRSLENEEPSVIVSRGHCVLSAKARGTPFEVDADECSGCIECLDIGCPAITISDDIACIDPDVCVGTVCGVCAQVCPQEAISERKG